MYEKHLESIKQLFFTFFQAHWEGIPVVFCSNATVEIHREWWEVYKSYIEDIFGREVNHVWSFQAFSCTWQLTKLCSNKIWYAV